MMTPEEFARDFVASAKREGIPGTPVDIVSACCRELVIAYGLATVFAIFDSEGAFDSHILAKESTPHVFLDNSMQTLRRSLKKFKEESRRSLH